MSANHWHALPRPPDSPVHRLPPELKLLLALAVILTVILLPRAQFWPPAGLLAVFLILVALASQISWPFLFKRTLLLEPLVLGVTVLTLLQPDGGRTFLFLFARTNLCLFTSILLASTTPFTEILGVLKRLRVPWLFVTTLTLMHRYLFVLADEAERMRRARASRKFTRGQRFQWLAHSSVVGQLFVRASERAERIYNAMCARGWK
jgi:cobalt/nickel transport system permease protein